MKLEKILDKLNFHEKYAFLKIVNNIIDGAPKNVKEIDQILNDTDKDLKNVDNINIVNVFNLIEDEFTKYVTDEFVDTTSQLDILTDIITRDGNCIMKLDWFARLYENEIKNLETKKKLFQKSLDSDKSDIEEKRKRDYDVYRACLNTAYLNDIERNQDKKITWEEQSVLLTLSKKLDLSQEAVKLINYLIVPPEKKSIDEIINELKNTGIIFYHKKSNTVYIADEIVRILRKIRGKEVADKFFRRVLKLLRESQINLICKKHNISWRLPLDEKITTIINEGISFSGALQNDIFKDGTMLTDKKKIINDFVNKGLKITPSLKGVTIEEKIANLIGYFENIEKDEKVSISIEGYEKMLIDLSETLPNLNNILKIAFELQEENILISNYLLDYNIKPRDVLEIINEKDFEKFCKAKDIKIRGNIIFNILDAYKDTENLYLENFENIGFRNLNALKGNKISIKEGELGVKFEELTKTIFNKLGFNVNETLRKKLNTNKDKIDIVLDLENKNLILVECKTVKEKGYDKFSSISRQIKSYINLAKINNFNVIRAIVVAPQFSDEFEKECRQDWELNLSLITASSLVNILKGLRESRHKELPYNLLIKDVLIKEDWVLKAISR
ncbi:MAG: hypothetical protein KAX05_12590 [Bacteroidales bacterium]|nr:hypothetical protein [Bacteroidales bacterium]